MNEAAKQWVAALRSGRYDQTRDALRNIDVDGVTSYCCLGVACEISNMGRWGEYDSWVDSSVKSLPGEGAWLSSMIQRRLGLKTVDGSFEMDGKMTSLTKLNDGLSKTFAEIADIIEANADQLFEADGQSAGLQPDR